MVEISLSYESPQTSRQSVTIDESPADEDEDEDEDEDVSFKTKSTPCGHSSDDDEKEELTVCDPSASTTKRVSLNQHFPTEKDRFEESLKAGMRQECGGS